MNSIDFSKAPEGAEYYVKGSLGRVSWYKVDEGYQGFYFRDGEWRPCAEGQGEWLRREGGRVPAKGLITPAPLAESAPTFEPFTSCEDAQPTGSKHDSGKPLMGAVPPNALLAVAKVLTFGAQKYGRDNWQQVENAETRYMDAALRHINAYQCGEQLDPESGENHLAHAVCSLMFILEKETRPAITPGQKEFADGVLDKFKHLSGAEKALAIGQHLIGEQIAKLK